MKFHSIVILSAFLISSCGSTPPEKPRITTMNGKVLLDGIDCSHHLEANFGEFPEKGSNCLTKKQAAKVIAKRKADYDKEGIPDGW